MKEKGQIVVLLLLVMVVALAIGLSMISRSILEVSTSRKSEDSSRAFSAAEAGIEKAIQANLNNLGGSPINTVQFDLGNQANVSAINPASLPLANVALEYPPFGKESYAQFWLADPNNITCEGATPNCYKQSSFDIYFGDPNIDKYKTDKNGSPADQPAIEIDVVYWDTTSTPNQYKSSRKYFDSVNSLYTEGVNVAERPASGFTDCGNWLQSTTTNNNISPSNFYCKANVTGYLYMGSSIPVMVRVRILYSNISHPVALRPLGGGSLPKQANIYKSTGTSGSTQRTLEVFQERAVMPQIFDYVLFSAKNLQKN